MSTVGCFLIHLQKIYDLLFPLFQQRYEYEGSVMKGQFETDPTFIERVTIANPNAKIHMMGDIHGSLHTLYYTLNNLNGFFVGDTWELTPDSYLIFLGDIVDYSFLSLECLALVFLIYIRNPTKVTILNGNHEDKNLYTSTSYQFQREMDSQIPTQKHNWERLLYYLPSAVYLDFMGKIYHLSHGAFDHNFCTYDESDPDEESELKEFLDEKLHLELLSNDGQYMSQYKWGDFYQSTDDVKIIQDSSGRYKFSKYVVNKYLTYHNIECIISGHQDNIPLGLLVKDEMEVDYNTYNIEKDIIPPVPYGYDLFVPIVNGYDDRNSNITINDLVLKPNKDFIALVTSNSTQSKPISSSCHIVLSNGPSISPSVPITAVVPSQTVATVTSNMHGGSHKNYKQLYMKYKAKYLLLSNIIKNKQT